MYEIGCLIVYDLEGNIITTTGESRSTESIEHIYPVGIPFIVLPYGEMKYGDQTLVRIDISDPENHKPVFEQIVREKTDAEKLAIAEAKLKELGVTV